MHANDGSDQLDGYLDRLARHPEGGTAANGLSAELSHTAVALHLLDARDRNADPRPHFLTHLEERLAMNDTLGASLAQPNPRLPHRSPASWGRSHRVAWPEPARRVARAGPMTWFATAGLLMVVALAAFASFRGGAPGGDGSEFNGFLAATPAAVSDLAYEPVDIAECTTTARPAGTVLGLVGQQPAIAPVLPRFSFEEELVATPEAGGTPSPYEPNAVDPATVLGDLPPADPAALDGIGRTVSELTACRFFFNPVTRYAFGGTPATAGLEEQYLDLDDRLFALFGDDFFRKEAFVAEGVGPPTPYISTYWIPFGPAPATIGDARLLPDGRVVAVVERRGESPYHPAAVMVFSLQGDRWLIEEVANVRFDFAARTQPYPQYLEVALQNTDGPSIASSIPTVDAFVNNRPVTVTVANLGDQPQEFRIDALGVRLQVEAGHSVSFDLMPPAGAYVMESYVPNPDPNQEDRPLLRLEQILRIVDEGTPVGMG